MKECLNFLLLLRVLRVLRLQLCGAATGYRRSYSSELCHNLCLTKRSSTQPTSEPLTRSSPRVHIISTRFCRGFAGFARVAGSALFPSSSEIRTMGDLPGQAFEQKVSTELLDEFLEEVMPPLLANSELRPWQVPSMGRSRQGGFLSS